MASTFKRETRISVRCDRDLQRRLDVLAGKVAPPERLPRSTAVRIAIEAGLKSLERAEKQGACP